jgi:hypothetical protein
MLFSYYHYGIYSFRSFLELYLHPINYDIYIVSRTVLPFPKYIYIKFHLVWDIYHIGRIALKHIGLK